MDRPKTTLANLPEVAMEKERERNINDKDKLKERAKKRKNNKQERGQLGKNQHFLNPR